MIQGDTVPVVVSHAVLDGDSVRVFDLRAAEAGALLPGFDAGAHVDVHLPNGIVRSYSLTNPIDGQHHYVIGVHRDINSRGGSSYLHDSVRVGDTLRVSAPRNNFCLNGDAAHTVLIGGGVGITPLWSMIQQLDAIGRTWQLYYCARSRRHAALLSQLADLKVRPGCSIHLHFDDEHGGVVVDLEAIVTSSVADAHFYCCGPARMLESFEKATAKRDPKHVHVEYFSAKEEADRTGGFEILLAREQQVIRVEPGDTILSSLLKAGVNVPNNCCEGVCGSCLVNVLDGIPDHRDLVLTDEEKAANDQMLVCCSGSKSARLVLDL